MFSMKWGWWLAIASAVAEPSEVVEVLALDLQEGRANRVASELLYDHIFIRFDAACAQHKDFNLADHLASRLTEAATTNSTTSDKRTAGFASLNQESPKRTSLPDAKAFTDLLNKHLQDARTVVSVQSMEPRIVPVPDSDDAGKAPSHLRRLGELSTEHREEEILSALHLLAASQLLGTEHVSNLLALEKRGSWREALEFVKEHAQVSVDSAVLQRLEKRLETKQSGRNAALIRTVANQGKSLQNEAAWMSHQALPVVTDIETLHGLGIRIVHNPLLGSSLLELAKILPCGEFEPEPDRTKEALGTVEPVPINGTRYKSIRLMHQGNLTVNPHVKKARSTFQSTVDSVEKKFLGLFNKQVTTTETDDIRYTLIAPNDPYFSSQWYLRGPNQGQPFGAQIIDGWSSMLRDQFLNSSTPNQSLTEVALEFDNLQNVDYGMTVAVLDSGCSRNQDLINQFWRNEATPGCYNHTFVGDPNHVSASGVSGDCVGYDFGNDEPDPTAEVEGKIHGSSTSGLIAAESNNRIGISGVCPHCRIMCLKIYNSEQQKITMSSVVRALNYVAEKGIKVSNHSYGGFGASEVEEAAHEVLNEMGHLSVCSAGNNGCDLDAKSGPNACLGETGELLGPFTPASYEIPNILSVGGTTTSGELAWFSNYGSKSVDVFAPGSDIITIYGKSQLASVKGTSFSAPIIAGMAAVVWSYKPELTALDVKKLIMDRGIEVASLAGKAHSNRIASLAGMLGGSFTTTLSDAATSVNRLWIPGLLLPLLIVILG